MIPLAFGLLSLVMLGTHCILATKRHQDDNQNKDTNHNHTQTVKTPCQGLMMMS